ncbi:MAG: NAD-dependent epimerase/dehydratase family protein [Gammaproteobacteria bacterium]
MTRPVLVTGAGGCIGAWTVRMLLRQNAAVTAFDLSSDRRRLELLCDDPAEVSGAVWETGDIADGARVAEVFAKHKPAAVIHLAALQVPYCIANPELGARANVCGTVNIFQSAKECGAAVAYASSVAATAMETPAAWKQTLYGAYKICNEQTARAYWEEDGVPSIGIRPAVVYGAGRDRGMSAAPTAAMLAAALGREYRVPFTGAVGFVHAAEAAAAFVGAARAATEGAKVFALNGCCKTVEEVCEMIQSRVDGAKISCAGAPLPFPSGDGDEDAPLRECVGEYPRPSFAEGLAETMDFFARRVREGRMGAADLDAVK